MHASKANSIHQLRMRPPQPFMPQETERKQEVINQNHVLVIIIRHAIASDNEATIIIQLGMRHATTAADHQTKYIWTEPKIQGHVQQN